MIAYLLGLATLPALALMAVAVAWAFSGPSWDTHYCIGQCPRYWRRDDHPRWPWWIWSLRLKAHSRNAQHGPEIRAWQAEHTVKPHWWSKRQVVR